MHCAVLIPNGDIFSRPKSMGTEAVSGLLVLLGAIPVVEHPARMLGAAGLVHQVTKFLLVAPEAAHAAIFTMLLPLRLVDMSASVEGRNEFVTMPRRAGGEVLRPREIQPDALGEHAASTQIVDVRERDEFYGPLGRIATAKWIPLGELSRRAGELSRDRPLVAVCRSGARSAQASVLLQRAGFRDVANLAGGMLRWRAEGHAVEGGRD